MPETGAADAIGLAGRMQEYVCAHEFETVGSMTLSIGASEYVAGEAEIELLARCDAAMYSSKRDGRNRTSLAEPPAGIKADDQK